VSPKVFGDPLKLSREAVKNDLEESLKLLDEAYEEAGRLIEKAYSEALKKAEARLKELYSRLEESVKSVEARLELDLRKRVMEEANRYSEEVIREAISRFKESRRGMKEYLDYLERILDSIYKEASASGSKARLLVARGDSEIVSSIIERKGYGDSLAVEGEADIIGGVIAVLDSGVRLDYSINNIITVEERRLRGVALRALLGER